MADVAPDVADGAAPPPDGWLVTAGVTADGLAGLLTGPTPAQPASATSAAPPTRLARRRLRRASESDKTDLHGGKNGNGTQHPGRLS
jgi:hypothetical protein